MDVFHFENAGRTALAKDDRTRTVGIFRLVPATPVGPDHAVLVTELARYTLAPTGVTQAVVMTLLRSVVAALLDAPMARLMNVRQQEFLDHVLDKAAASVLELLADELLRADLSWYERERGRRLAFVRTAMMVMWAQLKPSWVRFAAPTNDAVLEHVSAELRHTYAVPKTEEGVA